MTAINNNQLILFGGAHWDLETDFGDVYLFTQSILSLSDMCINFIKHHRFLFMKDLHVLPIDLKERLMHEGPDESESDQVDENRKERKIYI